MPAKIDIAGQRFGRLVAIAPISERGQGVVWRCLCDCGKETMVKVGTLRYRKTGSCGCLVREKTAEARRAAAQKYDLFGVDVSAADIGDIVDAGRGNVAKRLKSGMSPEQVVAGAATARRHLHKKATPTDSQQSSSEHCGSPSGS